MSYSDVIEIRDAIHELTTAVADIRNQLIILNKNIEKIYTLAKENNDVG